jgi:hypothetical protein
MVELALVYFPLGFCAGLTTRQHSRWWTKPILAVLPILVLVEGVEITVRSGVGGADVGIGMLGALTGAWLGAPGRMAFERWREAQAHTIEIM